MASRFTILGSGSSGNCALLQTDGARVLIDAGFSARRLDQLLATHGESLGHIDAIFLTHEHGDHAAGISGLARHPHIQVFANNATARAVQAGLKHRPNWQIFETGSRFRFRDVEVHAFSVPHDAHDPVGFIFTTGHECDLFHPRRTLAWVTDLGYAPAHVHEHLRDVDFLVVESNYCPDLLKADAKRPWSLKQRISGRHGHLSNDAARELLSAVASRHWRHVWLAHLSRECNSAELVTRLFAPVFAALGCGFSVVAPGEGAPGIDLHAA